jgi:plastocyanin
MRRLITAAVLLAAVLAVGSAAAKTVTIAVTKSGFVPKTASLVGGDAVAFVNQDTQAHQLVLKPSTGFTCTGSLTVQPGQTVTCTFRTAGSYALTDANNKGNAWKATISVAAAPGGALTLQVTPRAVTYGGHVTVSGKLVSGQTGQKIDVLAQECGQSNFKSITSLNTTTGGSYTTSVQPTRNTTYEVRNKNTTSAQVAVKVRPRVTLRKLATRKFRVNVLAADSFAGKYVVFQRYRASLRRWVTVRRVVLKAGATVTLPINPTTTSTATFRARVTARLRVRALLTAAQAGTCYAASASNVVRS